MIRRIVTRGWRQFLLLAAMLFFSGRIAQNLVYWQVTEHARVARAAAQVYDAESTIPAQRGHILDDQGTVLVTDITDYRLWADPTVVLNPSQPEHVRDTAARHVAYVLWRALHRDPDPGRLYHKLKMQHTQYVVLASHVDQVTADTIRKLALPGIVLTPTWHASYPQNGLAATVLGFVDDAGHGQYGLEQHYDSALAGRDGVQLQVVDTSNRPLPAGVAQPRLPVDGATLFLTLDSTIQHIVEERLARAVQTYGAESATAIVMDPHSGAILAMASLPSFDPNTYNTVRDPNLYTNKALQNYQPGSTFKVVSVASGLDSGAFTTATKVLDTGHFRKYGMDVRNWDLGGGWGEETPEIMLQHSANVGMAQFADLTGPKRFYSYVSDRFGFGSKTGIDLPAEYPGVVRTPFNGRPWQWQDLLTNSYGQSIDVTPLQLTTAVAALANGGVRMRPYLVQSIKYPDGRTVTAQPRVLGPAVNPATAATMTALLQQSAYEGEAMCALTKDYPVAAKTGTATIEGPGAYGYDLTQGTVASLVGYAPATDPRFVMLVTIRRPQPGPGNEHIWGSVVAAPVWHDIALGLYSYMSIAPHPGSTPAQLEQKQGPGLNNYSCEFAPNP